MHLPNSSSRQPFLNQLLFFLAKLSQLLYGFPAFPKMIRLVVYTLKVIHFGNTQDNKQERENKS